MFWTDRFKLKVKRGKTYMLRIANCALNEELFFKVAGHNLTVVEADAVYTKPFETNTLIITPGQTMNVLLTTNQKIARYLVKVSTFMNSGVAIDNNTATGMIEYKEEFGSYEFTTTPIPIMGTQPPPSNATSIARRMLDSLRSLNSAKFPALVPQSPVDQDLLFTIGLGINPCPTCPRKVRLVADINNVTFMMPTTALLQAHYFNISKVFSADFPRKPAVAFNYTETQQPSVNMVTTSGTRVYRLPYNSSVQLVYQDTGIVGPDNHPMHLHGYNFFVVGSGLGNFNPKTDPLNFNLVDPVERNTLAVPTGGWAAIRFRADNPGVWFMHCHLEVHTTWGLAMAFLVENGNGPQQSLLPPPKDYPKC